TPTVPIKAVMFIAPHYVSALLMAGTLTLFAVQASAQPKSPALRGLAVDVVTPKSGHTLRGAVLHRSPDGGVTVVVSRAWLRKAHPQQCDELDQENRDAQQQAWTQARDRLNGLLAANPPDQLRRRFFLQQERDRLDKNLATGPPTESDFL